MKIPETKYIEYLKLANLADMNTALYAIAGVLLNNGWSIAFYILAALNFVDGFQKSYLAHKAKKDIEL
jgi:hypothetical protein